MNATSSKTSTPSPIQLTSRAEFLLLMMMAGVQFTHIMDFMIMMPLGPQLMRLFDITPKQFGFIVSSYTLTAGATGFFGAFFVDRFDRKKALLFSYVGFALGTLACALAPTFEFLLAARSLAGAFGGVLGALILSVIGDAIPGERRGRAMGVVMASFSVASIFGVPFGLFLANLSSWHAPFYFVGGAAAVNAILIFFYMPRMTQHMENGGSSRSPVELMKIIGSDVNQLKALLFTFLLMFSQFSIVPYLSPYMVSNVGFTEAQLPYIYFFGGGLTIFTSPLVGRLADRYGKALIFTVGSFLVLIPMLIITNLSATTLPIALLVTTGFFVFSNSRFVPSMAMVTSTVPSEIRGGFMSINSSVQSLASSLAALCSGYIVGKSVEGQLTNYNVVGYIAVTVSVTAVFIGRRLVSRN